MVAPQSPRGCEKIIDWLTPIQTSYFIGPYNLHYLLFSGIGALLCLMSPSLLFSQPITNLVWNRCRSAPYDSRSQFTFSARKSVDFAGGIGLGGGGVDVVVLSMFWNTHIFRDWYVIIRILQPFLCFFFH